MGVSVPPAHGAQRLFSLDDLALDALSAVDNLEADEAIEDPPPPLDGSHEHPPIPPHLPPDEHPPPDEHLPPEESVPSHGAVRPVEADEGRRRAPRPDELL